MRKFSLFICSGVQKEGNSSLCQPWGTCLILLQVLWNPVSVKKLGLTVSLEFLCPCCIKILISVIVHTTVRAFWNQSFLTISNNSFPQQAYLILPNPTSAEAHFFPHTKPNKDKFLTLCSDLCIETITHFWSRK